MSWQMRAVGLFLKAVKSGRYASVEGADRMLTRRKGSPAPPAWVTASLRVGLDRMGGFRVYRVARPGVHGPVPVVVYLHGGAYVSEIVKQQWAFVAEVAERLDVEVWVPIYGLAPHHTAGEARIFLAEVLASLEEEGRPAYVVGDSAGGGLALLAVQHYAEAGGTLVRGMTLMAPWLDLTLGNAGIEEVEPRDPWLARAPLHEVARVWAGDIPTDDPRVSPIFGRLEDLPPVDLWVGTRDICLPDARVLADRLGRGQGGGAAVAYHEIPGGLHVFPLMPVPEGRAARAQIIGRIGEVLGVRALAG